MKNKYLIKLSIIFSIFFLFLLTSFFLFLYTISLKPIKISFLDYFDRKSEINQEYDIKEIGDVYISFNKISKNFEILAEDVVIGKNYLKNILIGIDITLSDKLFDTTLKLFDSRFTLKAPAKRKGLQEDNYLKYLNYFKNIEVINSTVDLILKDGRKKNYVLDLVISSKNNIKVLINEKNTNLENYLVVEKINQDELFKIELKNFSLDFLNNFIHTNKFNLSELRVSGETFFSLKNENFIENIKKFDLEVDSLFSFESNKDKQTVYMRKSKLTGKIQDNFLFSNFKFEDRGINFDFKIELSQMENVLSKIKVKLDKINTFQLLELWPKDFNDSVYTWMDKNATGNIYDLNLELRFDLSDNFNFDSVKGNFDFMDTEIKYMEDMPVVRNLKGIGNILSNSVVFKIKSGESDDLVINEGLVNLFDLDTDIEKAKISLKIAGENSSVMNYLDKSMIDEKTYTDLRNVFGKNFINLNLSFPLLLDLQTEQIKYNANVSIKDSIFKNFFGNISINQFNLDIEINDQKTQFSGFGKLLDSDINFEGSQKLNNNKFVNYIKGKYFLKADSIPKTIFDIELVDAGSIPIDFKIELMDDYLFNFEGIGNLDTYGLKSNFLGNNIITKGGRVRFIVQPFDKLNSIFFDLNTANLEAEVNANFDESSIYNIEISEFISPNQDFKLKFNKKNSQLEVFGNKLSLSDNQIFKKNNSNIKLLNVSTDLKEISINNSKFKNPKLNFSIKDNLFDALDIYIRSNEVEHKMLIEKIDKKKIFILESNYIPELIGIFDESLSITRGSLKIEGTKISGDKSYRGLIAGNDIVFSDAPFFADFFSLFSLQGLAQKIKDGGIIFDKFTGKYEISEDKLRLVDSLMKGSELGIQFDSVIGLDNDYFLTNGSIIPAYTLNTLITKFPIVGDIITAGSPEDGLIGANFKIEKDDNGEMDISYNPISVFLPNIIKNFLID